MDYYNIDGFFYPRVTAILSNTKPGKDIAKLNNWKKRVGTEEAERIRNDASQRGVTIHSYCENYMLGNPFEVEEQWLSAWNAIRPMLDRISPIFLEHRIAHKRLSYAGTLDCFGKYQGKHTIIDIKTANRFKKREEVHDYLLQLVAYAGGIYNQESFRVQQGLILMVTPEGKCQQFKLSRDEMLSLWDEWLDRLSQFLKQQISHV